MLTLQPVAFFSYARADDRREGGRLAELHRMLTQELGEQSQVPIRIFFDRRDIEWGDHWWNQVDTNLNGCTFFIPVLTPSYFNSEMCRKELRTFLKREARLGRSDLILPIYYLDSPQFGRQRRWAVWSRLLPGYGLARKVATRQWIDLRPLRQLPLDHPYVVTQVREAARQLLEAYARTLEEARVTAPPIHAGPVAPPAPGRPILPEPKDEPLPVAPDPPPRRRPRRRWLATALALLLVIAAIVWYPRPPADPPDLAGQSFTVASRWTGPERASFQDVLDTYFEQVTGRFEEETRAEVEPYEVTGEDAGAFLERRIAAGNPPDVAIISNPGLLEDLATAGHLKPIEGIAAEEVDANYDPFWRALGSVDGELYGVWFKAANKSTFWFNKNVFTAAGVDPPESWEELLDVAGKIADSGVAPFAIGGADGWVLTDWFENVYLRSAGPARYDDLMEHRIPWTHESVTEALTVLAEVFGNDEWIAGGAAGARSTRFEASVDQAFAEPPAAGMLYEADFVAGFIADQTNAVVGEGEDADAGFFPFPTMDGSEPSLIVGGDVAVLLTDNPAAQEFIRYLATPEAAVPWIGQGGMLSPNKNVDLSGYPDEVTRRAAEEIVTADSFHFDMSDLVPHSFGGTPGAGMRGALQDFLVSPDDLQGTQQRLEDAASRAYPP